MAQPFTIDASVFLNAFNPAEAGSQVSRNLLDRLQKEGTPIIVPTLLLPEVAAAIGRGTGDSALAELFISALLKLGHLVWVPLDTQLARQAGVIAGKERLRGSDSVYVAVATRFGSVLVTLDSEQHQRASTVVPTLFPADVN
jgi:predicted nucleic acid-binding protein